jgi:hypothetical protein
LVQQTEQFHHGGRRQLQVLLRVEPDQLAGKTQVQQHLAALAGQAVLFHRGATGGAGQRVGHGAVRACEGLEILTGYGLGQSGSLLYS